MASNSITVGICWRVGTKISNAKEAKLTGDCWNYSLLEITTEEGNIEVWKTRMIINISKLGKMFNQFPTRKV